MLYKITRRVWCIHTILVSHLFFFHVYIDKCVQCISCMRCDDRLPLKYDTQIPFTHIFYVIRSVVVFPFWIWRFLLFYSRWVKAKFEIFYTNQQRNIKKRINWKYLIIFIYYIFNRDHAMARKENKTNNREFVIRHHNQFTYDSFDSTKTLTLLLFQLSSAIWPHYVQSTFPSIIWFTFKQHLFNYMNCITLKHQHCSLWWQIIAIVMVKT